MWRAAVMVHAGSGPLLLSLQARCAGQVGETAGRGRLLTCVDTAPGPRAHLQRHHVDRGVVGDALGQAHRAQHRICHVGQPLAQAVILWGCTGVECWKRQVGASHSLRCEQHGHACRGPGAATQGHSCTRICCTPGGAQRLGKQASLEAPSAAGPGRPHPWQTRATAACRWLRSAATPCCPQTFQHHMRGRGNSLCKPPGLAEETKRDPSRHTTWRDASRLQARPPRPLPPPLPHLWEPVTLLPAPSISNLSSMPNPSNMWSCRAGASTCLLRAEAGSKQAEERVQQTCLRARLPPSPPHPSHTSQAPSYRCQKVSRPIANVCPVEPCWQAAGDLRRHVERCGSIASRVCRLACCGTGPRRWVRTDRLPATGAGLSVHVRGHAAASEAEDVARSGRPPGTWRGRCRRWAKAQRGGPCVCYRDRLHCSALQESPASAAQRLRSRRASRLVK